MRWTIAALAPLIMTGCGNPTTQPASDCALALHFAATTYVEQSFTESGARRVGQADGSECDDMGPEARGTYFPEHPRSVDVWAFGDLDPSDVLGVRETKGRFRVFIAEGLGRAEKAEILAALGDSSAKRGH